MQLKTQMRSFVSRKTLLFALFTALLVFLDQFVKYKIRFSGGFYICNSGISLGIILPPLFFGLIWLFFISTLFYLIHLYFKNTSNKPFFLFLILAGAFSNVLDRLFFGCVTDFIQLPLIHGFPIFNLADIYISTGIIFLLLTYKHNS